MGLKRLRRLEKMSKDASPERILEAAEAVFSETGFDGARVDVIADRAGVNKALLYYYFHSKEQLFQALIDQAIQETQHVVEEEFKELPSINEEAVSAVLDRIIDFVEQKKNILRIITMEGLKFRSGKSYIFEILDPIYQRVLELIGERKEGVPDRINFLIKNFFMTTVPLIVFTIFEGKWSEFYGVGLEDLRTRFREMFREQNAKMYTIVSRS